MTFSLSLSRSAVWVSKLLFSFFFPTLSLELAQHLPGNKEAGQNHHPRSTVLLTLMQQGHGFALWCKCFSSWDRELAVLS